MKICMHSHKMKKLNNTYSTQRMHGSESDFRCFFAELNCGVQCSSYLDIQYIITNDATSYFQVTLSHTVEGKLNDL